MIASFGFHGLLILIVLLLSTCTHPYFISQQQQLRYQQHHVHHCSSDPAAASSQRNGLEAVDCIRSLAVLQVKKDVRFVGEYLKNISRSLPADKEKRELLRIMCTVVLSRLIQCSMKPPKLIAAIERSGSLSSPHADAISASQRFTSTSPLIRSMYRIALFNAYFTATGCRENSTLTSLPKRDIIPTYQALVKISLSLFPMRQLQMLLQECAQHPNAKLPYIPQGSVLAPLFLIESFLLDMQTELMIHATGGQHQEENCVPTVIFGGELYAIAFETILQLYTELKDDNLSTEVKGFHQLLRLDDELNQYYLTNCNVVQEAVEATSAHSLSRAATGILRGALNALRPLPATEVPSDAFLQNILRNIDSKGVAEGGTILVVIGDGDLSFSKALAVQCVLQQHHSLQLIATVLDSEEVLKSKYKCAVDNIQQIESLACSSSSNNFVCRVKFGIDLLTVASEAIPLSPKLWKSATVYFFNFPFADASPRHAAHVTGEFDTWFMSRGRHMELLTALFKVASDRRGTSSQSLVVITLLLNQAVAWEVEYIAHCHDFELQQVLPIEAADGIKVIYERKRTYNDDSFSDARSGKKSTDRIRSSKENSASLLSDGWTLIFRHAKM